MVLECVGAPDVSDRRLPVPVPALVHDAREIRAPLGRHRKVPGPEGVSAESLDIEHGCSACARMWIGHLLRRLRRSLAA